LATTQAPQPTYDTLASALYGDHIDLSAAEVHGILTGIAVSPDAAKVDWAELLIDQGGEPGASLSAPLRALLDELMKQSLEALRPGRFALKLVLPEADGVMGERVAALADWCRGFIMGLAAAGVGSKEQVSKEAAEAIADLMFIGEATGEEETDGEEQERDFAELEEYVRIAVNLLADEARQQPVVH
jgi:yecA family protein